MLSFLLSLLFLQTASAYSCQEIFGARDFIHSGINPSEFNLENALTSPVRTEKGIEIMKRELGIRVFLSRKSLDTFSNRTFDPVLKRELELAKDWLIFDREFAIVVFNGKSVTTWRYDQLVTWLSEVYSFDRAPRHAEAYIADLGRGAFRSGGLSGWIVDGINRQFSRAIEESLMAPEKRGQDEGARRKFRLGDKVSGVFPQLNFRRQNVRFPIKYELDSMNRRKKKEIPEQISDMVGVVAEKSQIWAMRTLLRTPIVEARIRFLDMMYSDNYLTVMNFRSREIFMIFMAAFPELSRAAPHWWDLRFEMNRLVLDPVAYSPRSTAYALKEDYFRDIAVQMVVKKNIDDFFQESVSVSLRFLKKENSNENLPPARGAQVIRHLQDQWREFLLTKSGADLFHPLFVYNNEQSQVTLSLRPRYENKSEEIGNLVEFFQFVRSGRVLFK